MIIQANIGERANMPKPFAKMSQTFCRWRAERTARRGTRPRCYRRTGQRPVDKIVTIRGGRPCRTLETLESHFHARISLARFNHAALNATDVDASIAFYTQVLGFYEVSRPGFTFAGSWLYSDGLGMMLHLIQDERFTPTTTRDNTRRHHLAFRVADIDRTLEQLAELDSCH